MSGQRNKKPDDIVMKRQEYLDNLNLEIELQDANERAVRTYKETGQMPVTTQMKDNRTVEDKLRDVEKLKASIREDMAVIADSRLTDNIIQLIQNSPFNQDGNLLIFFAQRAPDIVKNLQKSYKFGIRGDQNDAEQFVSFVVKFYTDKNNLNSSTKQFMSRLGTTSKQGLSRKINEQAEILTRLETEMKRIVVHVKNTLPESYGGISLLPFKQSIVSKSEYLVKMITLIKEIYPANLIYTNKEKKLMINGVPFKAELQDFENVFNDRFKIEFGRDVSTLAQNVFDLFFNYINKNIPNLDYVNTMITKLQKQSDILIKRPDEINRISFIDALDNLDTVINTGENIEYIQNVKKAKDEILNYIYQLVIAEQYTRVNTIKYDYPLVPTSGVPTIGVPTSEYPALGVPTAEYPASETPVEGLLPLPPNPTTQDEYAYFAAIVLFNKILTIQKGKILPTTQADKIIDSSIAARNIIKDLKDYGIKIPIFTRYNTRESFLKKMKTKIKLAFNKINEETYKDDTDMPSLEYMGDVGEAAEGSSDIPATGEPKFDLSTVKQRTNQAYIDQYTIYLVKLFNYLMRSGIKGAELLKRIEVMNNQAIHDNNLERLRIRKDPSKPASITILTNTDAFLKGQLTELDLAYSEELDRELSETTAKPAGAPSGSGFGKISKIQGTGFPQPAYNFTKQKVEPTQGIQSDPRYIKFGRYLVNTKSLKDNKLSLRREKGTPIASLPVYKMSHPFSNVMKKIVGGALPTAEDFSQLTDDEKRYLHKVSKEADLSHKMEIPTPSKDEEEKDVHLFNVYKGEIMAGNDSKEMIKKFKLLMIKLVNNRSLDKRDVSEIMQMLTEAGY